MKNIFLMNIKQICVVLVAVFAIALPGSVAVAGTIILEGSDAIGLHSFGGGGAAAYRDQVWTAIGATDPRTIAIIGDTSAVGTGTHAVSNFASVAAAGSLTNYVALYFTAGGGCCAQNDGTISATGAQSAVASYLSGGGTVMIEDYIGGSAWDWAIGTGGTGNSHVAGAYGGAGGSSCSDGETVTALGLANGFTQPPTIGCWTHQAYDATYFGTLGFNQSFFNAGVDYPSGFSSLLSSGSTVTVTQATGVPEPASMAILLVGLVGAGIARRRV